MVRFRPNLMPCAFASSRPSFEFPEIADWLKRVHSQKYEVFIF